MICRSGYTSLKFMTTTSANPLSTISSNTSDTIHPQQSLNFLTQSSQEAGHIHNHRPAHHSASTTLHEDLANTPPEQPQPSYDTTIHRNPFLMRTYLDFSNFKLPNLFKSSKSSAQPTTHALQIMQPAPPSGSTHTRVWSNEEAHRLRTSNDSNEDCRGSTPSDQGHGVHVETSSTRETHRTQQR